MEQTFAIRLRQRRKQLGMTQQELATAAGLSRLTISQLENGNQREMHQNSLRDLAAALHTTPDVLRPELPYEDVYDAPRPKKKPTLSISSVKPEVADYTKRESGKDIIIAQLLRYIEELEEALGKKKPASSYAADAHVAPMWVAA